MVRNRARKVGTAMVFGQVCFRSLVVPYLRAVSRARMLQIDRQFGLDCSPIPGSGIVRVDAVNSTQCAGLLRDLAPRAIVVHGTRILSPQILSAAAGRFINLHAGITPAYRGVHGAYWALSQHQPELCGVTVHVVEEGIVTGAVLAQAPITPDPQVNFATT